MKILLLSATSFEVAKTLVWLEKNFTPKAPNHFESGALSVAVLYTGVGLPVTAFALGSVLASQKFDLLIQAGIGGALDQELAIGEVVEIISERFGDLGAETASEGFLDLQQLGLLERQSGIMTANGQMLNPGAVDATLPLKQCNGISVNRVTGSAKSIAALRNRYPEAQVESMEGAALFYAGLHHKVPFLQLRSISNYVMPRDRESWDIPLALSSLNEVLMHLFTAFGQAA